MDGVAKVVSEYDELGNLTTSACFGADNNLKAGPANYAIARWIYSKSGEAIECHCYGANGEPTLHKDGYSSWNPQKSPIVISATLSLTAYGHE